MRLISQRTMRRLSRRVWGTLFTLIIAIAVLVQLGRHAFPLLDDYRSDISELLGKRLGVDIDVGGLSADWSGLRPKITLTNVHVHSLDQQPIFDVGEVTAELGLVDSLLDMQPRWRELSFKRFQTTLAQAKDGHWQIKHLPMRTEGNANFTINDPIDIFLFGRQVQLDEVTFNLEFRTGHTSVLDIPSISLENDRDFHRATASVGLADEEGEQQENFQLVMEGYGDPRQPENFQSSGYIALKQFPMEKVVAAFAGGMWQQQDDNAWGEGHRLDLQLWFDGTVQKGMVIRGKLRSDGLPLEVPEQVKLPQEVSADITGRWHASEGWELEFQKMLVDWKDFQSPSINLKVHGGLKQPVSLAVDAIELKPWHDLAKKIGVAGGKAGKVLDALAPEGTLRNLDIQLVGKDAGYFQLKADLDAVKVSEFRGSPIVEKLNGVISANAFSGHVDIENKDGLTIAFPKIYNEPLVFESASGRVGWQIDLANKTAWVNSNRLQLVNGDEIANGYMQLYLPTVHDGREPKMTLAIGMREAPLSIHRKFIPKVIPKSLYKWLDSSIGEGYMTDLAFIYNGSISKKPKIRPSILFDADVHKAELAFDKHWPELKNVSGHLSLNSNKLDAKVTEATLLGNEVRNTTIQLINNPEDDGHAIAIRGGIHSNAAAAMELLKQSPVRNLFGDTFDSWQFGGNVSAEIALTIPLKQGAEGTQQNIAVDFNNANVFMRDIDLSIADVQGRLNYSSDKGLSANKLTGSVWGKPLTANIESPLVDAALAKRDTVIHFNGPVDVSDIRDWTKRPELGFVEGNTEVSGRITIPAVKTTAYTLQVELESQLKGVIMSLPEPLAKSADQEKPFSVDLRLHHGYQRYEFNYDNNVTLRLVTGKSIDNSAQLTINTEPKPLQPGEFGVLGRVKTFDIEQWDAVREKYFEYINAGKKIAGEGDEANMPIRMDLNIAAANFGDVIIDKVRVTGVGTEDEWRLHVDSHVAKGDILVVGGQNDLSLDLDLDTLRLGSEVEVDPFDIVEQESAWSLSGMDLKRFTFPINFSVNELYISGQPYGRWAFNLKPLEDGIALTNLQADIRGMIVGKPFSDKQEAPIDNSVQVDTTASVKTAKLKQSPRRQPLLTKRQDFVQSVKANPHAEFIWRQTDKGNFSSFSGSLMAAKGTGNILEAWGAEKIVDSQQAIMLARVTWPGAPDDIKTQSVRGKVVFDLEDGSFVRGAGESDNGLLRLIALFNFDSIVRRLKLDFSDLAKSGFAFETVHGEFLFEDGWVYIHEPLVVNSTSSKIQVAGTLNLIEEDIDAELVATLPVAGDMTIAAALVAGLPAAVGVFVISKMFKEQVNKASSINYRITGDWDDPKIKFRKIFDDSAVKSKAKQVESLRKESDLDQPLLDPYNESPEPTPIPD